MAGVVAISTISPNSFSARATAPSLMVRSPQDVALRFRISVRHYGNNLT